MRHGSSLPPQKLITQDRCVAFFWARVAPNTPISDDVPRYTENENSWVREKDQTKRRRQKGVSSAESSQKFDEEKWLARVLQHFFLLLFVVIVNPNYCCLMDVACVMPASFLLSQLATTNRHIYVYPLPSVSLSHRLGFAPSAVPDARRIGLRAEARARDLTLVWLLLGPIRLSFRTSRLELTRLSLRASLAFAGIGRPKLRASDEVHKNLPYSPAVANIPVSVSWRSMLTKSSCLTLPLVGCSFTANTLRDVFGNRTFAISSLQAYKACRADVAVSRFVNAVDRHFSNLSMIRETEDEN
ncbi:uncharacterized protein BDR25DRAFT_357140 [Lindgomyces ingoldianus]|uniref:Uncharacterized protein n=1 Tax=Lindgomyces ingoldianus TaxID=673940 RepID=A0ACB6QP37_9PLEO|nr:uncharacterized protein BDR25DRAFT_357140 [Lindgomyces ingoldianus]KAF2468779.1 hypothetical protein BDR25DRAFT_357140 [Lindgomyces ingoldianus]